ncbi:MAG TPA: ABC transporter permease [Armatimonadetes bacterium]|nr:ABC transporter permease [Armatimonadota bacterium]
MRRSETWRGVLNTASLLAAWLVIFLVFSVLKPESFPSVRNLETILRQSTIVAMSALAMTYVIVSAGIDLSVGSIAACVSVVIAVLLKDGYGPWTAVAVGLACGAAIGLLNGVLIARLKVGPFIVTLGTYLIVRGVAKGLGQEQTVDPQRQVWLNDLLGSLGPEERWRIFPNGIWLLIALAVLAALTLRHTRFGRHVVAIGSNEQAARLCGVNVEATKVWIYTLSGLFAGLSGLMLFSRLRLGDPTAVVGMELEVIAGVVIGGASLSGGEGSVVGSIIGVLIMYTIRSGCAQYGLPNWVQEIVTGAIIVAAVALDRLRLRKTA